MDTEQLPTVKRIFSKFTQSTNGLASPNMVKRLLNIVGAPLDGLDLTELNYSYDSFKTVLSQQLVKGGPAVYKVKRAEIEKELSDPKYTSIDNDSKQWLTDILFESSSKKGKTDISLLEERLDRLVLSNML